MLKVVSFPFSGFEILRKGILEAMGVDLSPNLTTDEFGKEEVGKCIVLIRSFELAVEDWHKSPRNTSTPFNEFRESKVEYYDRFIEKWVNSQLPDRLTLTYLDLTSDTLRSILTAYRFITGTQASDQTVEQLQVWLKGKSALELLKSAKNTQETENQPLSYFNEQD